jgi:hypothetical protein
VTVLVLPTIIQASARAEPAGGAEASEAHLAPANEGGAAAHRAAHAAGRDEETTDHSPGAPPAAPSSAPEPRDLPPPESFPYKAALLHFVSTAAAIIVALGVFCAGLLLLRRLGVSLPVGSWPGPAGGGANAMPVPDPGTEPVPEAVTNFDLASNFDLGPTYADEARQRKEAAREREQALLRQFFEQNLRLREQIGEPAGPGESAAPGVSEGG